jgi:hypothetical protein
MGFKNAFRGLFGSKEENKEVVHAPQSFSQLKVGNTFNIDICDVYDMSGMTFEVMEVFNYVVSTDHVSNKVLTIKSIETGKLFRACEVSIHGTTFIRIDNLLSDDEVIALFLNDDEEDFRTIFSDELTMMFKMKRFALGDEATTKPLLDWTAEEYKFTDDLGIQGYIEKNGNKEAIQYYSLTNSGGDYGVIIENYEDGVAKVYLSHYLAVTNISSFS